MRKLSAILLLAFLTFGMPRAAQAQVTVAPFLTSNPQFLDGSGSPLASGCVFTYAAGTTTPLVTYSDSAGSTPNSNPVILNSGGFPQAGGIWLTSAAYKFVVKSNGGTNCSTGSTITTTDGITWATAAQTFAGIVSTGDVTLQQGTAATNGANHSSNNLKVQGTFWNGSASATESCNLQDVLGTGANPTVAFTLTCSGSSGATTFSVVPNTIFAGDVTGSGNTTLSNLNKTIYAHQQAGADACAKIVTSCGLLASTGGTVDATGFQGNQTCAAGITCAANKPIKIKLGAAAFITGANTAITCPAGGLLTVVGLGPTGNGAGTTSTISSTASSAAIQWNCSEGSLEDLLVLNTVGDGISFVASGTNSVQHNHLKHLHIASSGVINAGKAGMHSTAASATALMTENTFDDINIDDFDISELNDSSAAQGPTDNHHHGFTYTGFAGLGTAGIKNTLGDTNDWAGGFVSGRATGFLSPAGSFNVITTTRMEANTKDVNDSGTGNMFIGDTLFNCATSTFAASAFVLVAGNTPCAINQIPNGVTVTPKVQTFTSNGTFTIPTGVRAVKVTVIAAGGAGGGASTTTWGTGGGSGGTGIKYLSGLTPGNTIAVTVGTGGTGVANATGNTGGDSTIASGTQTITTVTAKGGVGGITNAGAQPGGAGGAAGTNGDINAGGQPGGTNTANSFGGNGAPSTLGGGGNGPGSNVAGNAGTAPGAGGSGSSETAAGTSAGGAGAAGIVIFEWSN